MEIDKRKVLFNGESGIPLKTLLSWIKTKPERRKIKETKGKAEDGSYCPKKKFGQSWAYIKDTGKEEEE